VKIFLKIFRVGSAKKRKKPMLKTEPVFKKLKLNIPFLFFIIKTEPVV